ncbi:hypothetical protein CTA2_1860, partial [Colletotrichum tanaceti]
VAHSTVFRSRTWLHRETESGAEQGRSRYGPTADVRSGDHAVSSYADHLAAGQKIVQQASDLLGCIQELEDVVKGSECRHRSCYDMFMSATLYFKISTLRLFAHPLWQNASISMQELHEPKILEYAHSALEHLERRMPRAGVEAFMYIDHLVVFGLEMRHSLDRLRIISLLDAIKSRGFGFAEVYIEDLQLAWKAVPSARSSPASGPNAVLLRNPRQERNDCEEK